MNIKKEAGIRKFFHNIGFDFASMESTKYHFSNDELHAVFDPNKSEIIIYHDNEVIYENHEVDDNFDVKLMYEGIKNFI